MIQLQYIVLRTNQLHAQATFYTQLGLQLEYRQHGNGALHYASKSNPFFQIHPLLPNMQVDKSTRLGFFVSNLDELVKQLVIKGRTIVQGPKHLPWGYSAIVEDLDGRQVELTQR
ncbi:hypothetical protein LX64_01710 [Chitinophaga skermanii]|uniref:VOC domain-containing protein n=1 Tax=Chitinophaga skermanii TaxID=331697 RepID=A0A327QT40_9BACT|nr:VOC family protein [Chitinophaga skermanii]RAJ06583.1 hypothetical protein LX64_01710 [Chitinophaga skermanii]